MVLNAQYQYKQTARIKKFILALKKGQFFWPVFKFRDSIEKKVLSNEHNINQHEYIM